MSISVQMKKRNAACRVWKAGDLQRPLGPVHNVLKQPHHQPQLDEHIVRQVFQAEFGLLDLADDLQRLLKALAIVAAEAPQPEHDHLHQVAQHQKRQVEQQHQQRQVLMLLKGL